MSHHAPPAPSAGAVPEGHDPHGVLDLVPPPSRTGPDFPVLDALRAVGALAVLTTHVSFWSALYTGNGALGSLLARLDVGVAIFFVLSGFLLARPWLAAAADGRPTPATVPYLRRRLWRIAPLYLVTVLLALTFLHDNGDLGWGERVRTLLMLNTFGDSALPAGLTQMWSLAVEVSFYLVLPVIMLLVVGRRPVRLDARRVALGLAALAAVTLWWFADGAARVADLPTGLPLQWLPGYLTWFGAGVALAWVQVLAERGRASRWTGPVQALGRQPGSCWALVAGLLLVAASPVAGPVLFDSPTVGEEITKNLVYALVGTLVVLTGVFPGPGSAYARVMSHPLARRAGWISFGVFCLHLPVIYLVMWVTGWTVFHVSFWPLWLLTVVVSTVVAELAYRLVERPGVGLGERLARRSRHRSRRRRDRGQGRGSRSEPPTSTATSGTSTR